MLSERDTILRMILFLLFSLVSIEARAISPTDDKNFAVLLEEFKLLEPVRQAALETSLKQQKNNPESVKLLESFKEVHSYLTTYRTLYESAYVVFRAMEVKRKTKESDQALKILRHLERPENKLWHFKELGSKVSEQLKIAPKEGLKPVLDAFNNSFQKLEILEARFQIEREKYHQQDDTSQQGAINDKK